MCTLLITFANSLNADLAGQNVGAWSGSERSDTPDSGGFPERIFIQRLARIENFLLESGPAHKILVLTHQQAVYGKCSKISNTLKLRTPKIIA